MVKPYGEFAGRQVYVERRRYSNRTFTWLHVKLGNGENEADWIQLGDPWPCITPKRSEIVSAVNTFVNDPLRKVAADGQAGLANSNT